MVKEYRRILTSTWGDKNFKALSSPTSGAKYLWLYLLTNPFTSGLPGLYEAGEAMMAEAIGWDLKVFRAAFREIERAGMVFADWGERIIYIPNAIKHNPPESPNVIIYWAGRFDKIPEGTYKELWLAGASKASEGWGEKMAEAFRKAFLGRSRILNMFPDQEYPVDLNELDVELMNELTDQVQEHQEREPKAFVIWYAREFKKHLGKEMAIDWGRDMKMASTLLKSRAMDVGEVKARAVEFLKDREGFPKGKRDLPAFKGQINRYGSKSKGGGRYDKKARG